MTGGTSSSRSRRAALASRRHARKPRKKRPASDSDPSRYQIRIANEGTRWTLPAVRLRRIAREALASEDVSSATISIALIGNATMRRLNREHLDHDFATDVLSFLFESTPPQTSRGGGRRLDGEVVISVEMAEQSAGRFGWSPADELSLYLIHGLLHLCGYDDLTEGKRRRMRRREQELLERFAIFPARST